MKADPVYAPAQTLDEISRQVIGRGVDDARLSKLVDDLEAMGAYVVKEPATRLFLVQAPTHAALAEIMKVMISARSANTILFVERNQILRRTAIPNDPLYGDQWPLVRIRAEAAWGRIAGLPVNDVKVAVVDSGIHAAHEDIVTHYHSGIGTSPNVDEDCHGTLLAGTIGAVVGNAKGVAGAVGPKVPVKLMSVKFFSPRVYLTSFNGAVAIIQSVLAGASVINASWDVGMPSWALEVAIDFAELADRVFVAAAGNDGTDNDRLATWPANHNASNVISVMASDRDDDKLAFSNYGPGTVHLAAPGVGVLTTYPHAWPETASFKARKYRSYSGTSPAAAHVSGAAAMLRALKPNIPASHIRTHLMASGDASRWLPSISGRRLNLERAVTGPISVTQPAQGTNWPKGGAAQVKWLSSYTTPLVQTLAIWLDDHGAQATPPVQIAAGVVATAGSVGVNVPNRVYQTARLRLVSEQASFLIAESRDFAIQ